MTVEVILFMYSYFNNLWLYLERILLNILCTFIHEFYSYPQYGQARRVHLHKHLSTEYYYALYG